MRKRKKDKKKEWVKILTILAIGIIIGIVAILLVYSIVELLLIYILLLVAGYILGTTTKEKITKWLKNLL